MSDRVTGADLVHQLWVAARGQELPLGDYIKPLTSKPSQFIRQLKAAERPAPTTLARVHALIAGEAVPNPRSRIDAAVRWTAEDHRIEIERKRAIAEAAAECRRPGETLHSAVRRLELELA